MRHFPSFFEELFNKNTRASPPRDDLEGYIGRRTNAAQRQRDTRSLSFRYFLHNDEINRFNGDHQRFNRDTHYRKFMQEYTANRYNVKFQNQKSGLYFKYFVQPFILICQLIYSTMRNYSYLFN